ncbi:MAG TPA: alpha/beta hydrolase [Patescibacteria group bacterium]|nr:alpha/beta hydrolase [Patescibacteria group bacterium]
MEVEIPIKNIILNGHLTGLPKAKRFVIYAHGSSSSRFSPRNKYVAQVLNSSRIQTMLIDLLTKDEEVIDGITRELRFNIRMLAERLVGITNWAKNNDETKDSRFGYFVASTGAEAELMAVAELPYDINAVVSRVGRSDIAGSKLSQVKAPTLLLVGGLDESVIDLNQQALNQLGSDIKELQIIEGATHLFEEIGTLEQVADKANSWFIKYLSN